MINNNNNNIKEADWYMTAILLFILLIVVLSSCTVTVNVYKTPALEEPVEAKQIEVVERIPGNKNYKNYKK